MVHDVLCDCGAPVPYPGGRCDRWPRGCSRYYTRKQWIALLVQQGRKLQTTCRHKGCDSRAYEYLARGTDWQLRAICPVCKLARRLTRDEKAALA
jgi:hypothetical protein